MTTTRSTTPTMPRWPGPAPAEVPPGRQPRALQFGRLGPMAPVARIITDDGAQIRFDGRGYATRRSQGDPSWRVAATLYFTTVDSRYSWLNGALALWEGEFNQATCHSRYTALLQPTVPWV